MIGIWRNIQHIIQLVLDFLVKEAGNYALSFMGSEVGNYGTNAAFYIDDMYVGTFNFAHPSDSEDASVRNREVVRDFNSLYLGQGTHTITIKSLYKGSVHRHNTLYMAGFDFTKLEGELYYDAAVAEVGKSELVVGESTDLSTGAKMSDGSWRNMGTLIDGSEDTKTSRGRKFYVELPNTKTDVEALKYYVDKEVILGIRPENIHDEEMFLSNAKTGIIEATVDVTEMMGAESYLYLTCEGIPLTARVSPRCAARPQDVIKLALDPNKIHLFDPNDEHSILL